ncbi:MAG: DNA-binding protein WhiA [Synergistetes bacterium]|nr:DNA-binding protein WhiA [Synergistota bacterium]
MSFYTSLREEIVEKLALTEDGIKAEISGFLATKTEPSLKVRFDLPAEARKFCKYLDILQERHSLRFEPGSGYEILLKRFPDFAKIPTVYLNDTLWGDFLRGLLWGCGSMIKPWKGYHLEIGIPYYELAVSIEGFLRKRSFILSLRFKKGRYYLTFRNMSSISLLLKAIGAERSLKKLQDVWYFKKIRERANREANCDIANAERIAFSSLKDRILIGQLGSKLEELPRELREIAELRLKNPSLSLREIGALMDPPLSKMGVYRALRRIRKLSEKWKEVD